MAEQQVVIEQQVKEDVLSILQGVLNILGKQGPTDVVHLKELSDHCIHDASIYQDEFSVEIAILIYSLYKILERGYHYQPSQYRAILKNLRHAHFALQHDKFKSYKRHISNLFALEQRVDKQFSLYVQEVIEKAKITKASKLFVHGLSIATAAKVMGVTQWQLAEYVGKMQSLEETGGLAESKRFDIARRLFE